MEDKHLHCVLSVRSMHVALCPAGQDGGSQGVAGDDLRHCESTGLLRESRDIVSAFFSSLGSTPATAIM